MTAACELASSPPTLARLGADNLLLLASLTSLDAVVPLKRAGQCPSCWSRTRP